MNLQSEQNFNALIISTSELILKLYIPLTVRNLATTEHFSGWRSHKKSVTIRSTLSTIKSQFQFSF
jgi:hypothetical protein